jgi:dCTP diphosphatase
VNDLGDAIKAFIEERDWEQFHSPKNLAMALSVEASEVVEHFQWLTQEQSRNLPPKKLAEIRE